VCPSGANFGTDANIWEIGKYPGGKHFPKGGGAIITTQFFLNLKITVNTFSVSKCWL
jgi:hypothetical protein